MSKFIRQSHRWVSIAFTATVIANFVAMAIAIVTSATTDDGSASNITRVSKCSDFLGDRRRPYVAKWRGGRQPSLPLAP